MEKKKPEPWTIYLWRRGDKIEGASEALGNTYRQGWDIEVDKEVKRNEDRHKEWRAKVHTKNMLNNTLNVLRWYGKKVLDSKGNIDVEKLRGYESQVAYRLADRNLQVKRHNITHRDKIAEIDMNDVLPILKYKNKEISPEEAKKYGFI